MSALWALMRPLWLLRLRPAALSWLRFSSPWLLRLWCVLKSVLPLALMLPLLSRPSESWAGARGYIQQHVLTDYADLSAFEVYACGSSKMIMGAQQVLEQERGLPKNAFFSDAFTEASV